MMMNELETVYYYSRLFFTDLITALKYIQTYTAFLIQKKIWFPNSRDTNLFMKWSAALQYIEKQQWTI